MPLLCKQRALYVKGCVIPNGITDSQGDTLYKEDIKKIFTTFNNQDNFEVYHNDLAIPEVSLLENYISTADERIGNLIIPPGSWNCVIRVDNPEIQEGLLTGELGGLSLSNRIADRCKANLHGIIRYQDVVDAECVIPIFISFVEGGANGYPLHVMDYDAYIQKSDSVVIENKGAKYMAFNLLDGLKSLIQQAEASEKEDEAPVVEKADETKKEEQVVDETTTTTEEEPAADDATVDENADEEKTIENEEDEEPTVEKAEETLPDEPVETPTATNNDDNVGLEERVAALEKIVAELTATEEPETDEEVEEETVLEEEEGTSDEDTPKITKSEKVVIPEQNVHKKTNYYEMAGRDPLTGKKIR